MFHDNIVLQTCALAGFIGMCLVLIVTFIPAAGFDDEVEHPVAIRLCMMIIVLGLLRGAF